jgi:MFS transporter, OPA family, glycerol-3-phosphate transporter
MNPEAPTTTPAPKYSQAFGARRGFNWFSLGLMYASYYMCRYNFRWAVPDMRKELNLGIDDIAIMLGCWSWAYGVGQLVNGLFTDRIGGKKAMLYGAIGTIVVNLIFGATSAVGGFMTFTLLWTANGYVQAFGAPGMVKINGAWFSRQERGTFAGVFGFMIQLGLIAINQLAPALLLGFSLFIWTVPGLHWKWLFFIPPLFTAAFALLMMVVVKETPEEAGHHGVVPKEGAADEQTTTNLKESFQTIIRHPLVWFYAMAYACTGAVRHGGDQFAILYFVENLGLNKGDPFLVGTLQLMPLFAVFGSFLSGWLSDKVFKGHRSPVAMCLYLLETVVIVTAVLMIQGLNIKGMAWSALFLILISFTANSTHSLVGTAAPMDIGGRKMAGFAAGVIDSFQYFGSGIAVPLIGYLVKHYGWNAWFPTMAGFGFLGAIAMFAVMRKQKKMAAEAKAAAGV